MARDTQQSKVYTWEKIAYPGYLTDTKLTPSQVRSLVAQVHADVNCAGGVAATTQVVKFTKRAGGACALWGSLNFTPNNSSLAVVLHEIAHSLTWCPNTQRLPLYGTKQEADRVCATLRRTLDDEGHGPRFVACMIALLERYAQKAPGPAIQTARLFQYEVLGAYRTVRTETLADGGLRVFQRRSTEIKSGSVKVDLDALSYWRRLLGSQG